jgi:type IV pilus assembly protein PilX
MRGSRQGGMTLLMALVMTIALLLIGTSAAELAWQGEKAARAQRDGHVAFQAAEAALDDAENDIKGGAAGPAAIPRSGRAALFAPSAALDGTAGFSTGCISGPAHDGAGDAEPVPDASRGLLERAQGGAKPVWQVVDLSGAEDGGGCSVPFGSFTGAAMETGQGFLPFKRPRYIVERMECHQPGDDAGAGAGAGSGSGPSSRYCYRVTAIGFGAQPETQVVLQSVFRRPD